MRGDRVERRAMLSGKVNSCPHRKKCPCVHLSVFYTLMHYRYLCQGTFSPRDGRSTGVKAEISDQEALNIYLNGISTEVLFLTRPPETAGS